MADNVTIPVPIPVPVASDDIGGVHYQRIKITLGADGVNDGDVSAANPMPVDGPLTDTELRAAPVLISGPLTDIQLRAAPVLISGPLTDTQLRAAPVPISGPLTDTQLRATPVPISGPLTDTQLRATAVPVSAATLPLPAGAATEATLSTLNGKVTACDTGHTSLSDILVALKEIFNAIARPMSMDAATSRMRTAIESSVSLAVGTVDTVTTVATVTGVTTVTGITNLGGIAIAGDLSRSMHLTAWANCIRARIS